MPQRVGEALHEDIEASGLSVRGVASRAGIGHDTLYRALAEPGIYDHLGWVLSVCGGRRTLQALVGWANAGRARRAEEEIAAEAHGELALIEVPAAGGSPTADVLRALAREQAAHAAEVERLAAALEDGRVTMLEAGEISAAVRHAVACALELEAAVWRAAGGGGPGRRVAPSCAQAGQ